MDIYAMRDYVMQTYPNSNSWHYRVSQMDDSQVRAIYYNMIGRKKKPRKSSYREPRQHQITMEEVLNEQTAKAGVL